MKKQIGTALVAMALVAGCGEPEFVGVEGDTTDEVATTEQGIAVDLRMRAVGAERFDRLLLVADDVRITADGIPVAVSRKGDLVDLADMGHATKLASFRIPEGAQNVEFTVLIGAAGAYDARKGSGLIDSASTTLRFTSPVANLVAKNKAVIEVDAIKSFVDLNDGLAMVPKYRVEY